VAAKLGLKAEPISTQVIPRDRHAMYFATLGVVAASMERLATEIRHLQRTEVGEAEEFFAAGEARTPAAHTILDRLADVGLGYLSLGQPLTTLSGGERQRL
jgi:ABC-type iron transport system FetAB ATPase subunit